MKWPTFTAAFIYTQVVYKVSSFALTLLYKHHVSTYQCNSKFRWTMSLPCKHSDQNGINADSPFTLKISTRIGGRKKILLLLLQAMWKATFDVMTCLHIYFKYSTQHQPIIKLLLAPTPLIQYWRVQACRWEIQSKQNRKEDHPEQQTDKISCETRLRLSISCGLLSWLESVVSADNMNSTSAHHRFRKGIGDP